MHTINDSVCVGEEEKGRKNEGSPGYIVGTLSVTTESYTTELLWSALLH